MQLLTGRKDDEVLNHNLMCIFPELENSPALNHFKAAFNKEQIHLDSCSHFPLIPAGNSNFSISFLPVLNDQDYAEACLVVIQERPEKNRKQMVREEIRNKTLTENPEIGLWQIDKEGYTVFVNQAMCRILNITSIDDLQGKTYHSFFTKESQERISQASSKRLRNQSSTYEVEIVTSGGEIRNILLNGAPMLSAEGKLDGMIGTFLDITEGKISQASLEKSEERFRLFFEKNLTPTGISRDGILLSVNEAFVRLFKYNSAEELIENSVLSLVDESLHPMILENIKSRAEGKDVPSSYELVGIKKDGSKFLFHLEISGIELPDGMANIVAINDISIQKEAEKALLATEAKFKGLFRSNMIGIAFSDSKSRILDANDKLYNIIQYTKEDVLANNMIWTEITPPEYYELDTNAELEYSQKGYFSPYEKEFIRKDGKRVPVVLAGHALEGSPDLGVAFIIDISDLKKSKEEINKIGQELTTFLYMASHDLKGPLASVIGLTNIARNDIEDLKALEYLNLIQECTMKLDRSLMNFLKIIKIKNYPPEQAAIDFNPLIDEIIESLMHQASFASAEFVVNNNLKTSFHSDPDLIRSIIQNLIENSVKYQTRLRKPIVKIQIDETEEDLVLRVDDNGRGIDEKIKDKIFDIFYRGDISSKGSGLGLYIVKSAVEKFNGTVSVENKAQGGSVFTITLPKKNNFPHI